MGYLVDHPWQTFLLLFGGTATAGSIWLVRRTDYGAALACAGLSFLILVGASWMMLRTDWGSVEEWGPVATDARQTLNFVLVGIGVLVAGVGAMWFGFGPGSLVGGVLLITGGWALFICGVVCLVGWLKARGLFAR